MDQLTYAVLAVTLANLRLANLAETLGDAQAAEQIRVLAPGYDMEMEVK